MNIVTIASSPEPDSPPPLLTPSRPATPISLPRRAVKPPSGVEVIDLDGRDEMLPIYYRLNSHPQLSHVPGVRNVYIYIQDTDEDATHKYLEFIRGLVLPDGTQTAVAAAGKYFPPLGLLSTSDMFFPGYLELEPGDYVFARDKWGSGLAKDDVVQVWVTPE